MLKQALYFQLNKDFINHQIIPNKASLKIIERKSIMNKEIKQILNSELVIHCVEVKVYQNHNNGIKMSGHGTIKINSVGTLYLEFICTYSDNVPYTVLGDRFPKDPLDDTQKLYLEAKDLNGKKYKSEGFSITTNLKSANPPAYHFIILSSIYSSSKAKPYETQDSNFLHFYFSEKFRVPPNKLNEEESTLGFKSSNWNQTIIDMNDYSISMVKHIDYIEVWVIGDFDPKTLLKCLKFYIGFSSGSMPQFFYIKEIIDTICIETISSISNPQKRQLAPSPMVDNIANDKYKDHFYHYNLLKNIISLYEDSPKLFQSIYLQWERVWYSWQSKNSIMILTLSVAIEGLLNDIYIPSIKSECESTELLQEIDDIKLEISTLNLTDFQKNRLISSVNYWKNITASKALKYLIDNKIITNKDKRLWTKLRNKSAHPRVQEDDLAKQVLEQEQVLSCLDLFHKLILNILRYSGPIRVFQLNEEFEFIELTYTKVLN